jgi:hypothetical protein
MQGPFFRRTSVNADDMTREQQEEHGRVHEWVQKMVDGLIEDVTAGRLPTQAAACDQLVGAAEQTAYCRDYQDAVLLLRYALVDSLDRFKVLSVVRLAAAKILLKELDRRPEYRALPRGDEHAEETRPAAVQDREAGVREEGEAGADGDRPA